MERWMERLFDLYDYVLPPSVELYSRDWLLDRELTASRALLDPGDSNPSPYSVTLRRTRSDWIVLPLTGHSYTPLDIYHSAYISTLPHVCGIHIIEIIPSLFSLPLFCSLF